MNTTVQFTVDLTIADGKLAAFESIAKAMSTATEKEPGARAYAWYLSADRTKCRLIEIYVDGDAVVAHLKGPVVGDLVPRLLQVSKLNAFEVYGDPGPEASAMLAGFGAQIYKHWLGFSR